MAAAAPDVHIGLNLGDRGKRYGRTHDRHAYHPACNLVARQVSSRRSSRVVEGSPPAAVIDEEEPPNLHEIEFSVDSALLQELGERLVGQSHIALAELIKNSYDADATLVEVIVRPDSIVVTDDGHGMDREAFEHFWMRIGSQHKDQRGASPGGRRMTGSKGVGRLSAQFLANRIQMTTRAERHRALFAKVDWLAAVKARELTKAKAQWAYVRSPSFAGGASHGTTIRLVDLKQAWDAGALQALARELWPLQPPYAVEGKEIGEAFRVDLDAGDPVAEVTFARQMRAVLELWTARIVGRVKRKGEGGELRVRVQFRDDEIVRQTLSIPGLRLEDAEFEIRVFDLKRRQPYGIKVEEARGYLHDFGGVHIYDAGFHLPYYGPDVDWLGIERDHSHRLSASKLLPEELHIAGGLNFLPTNTRLYGAVQIDTGAERAAAKDDGRPSSEVLAIQISRDRLIDNRPYAQLRDAVRSALDLYAMEEARRRWDVEEGDDDILELSERAARVEEVLDRYADRIPEPVLDELRTRLRDVAEGVESEAQQAARQAGMLGALATAGISAIAVEHETGRQIAELRRLAKRLRSHAEERGDVELEALADELSGWTQTMQSTRALFGAVMDEESREKVQRFAARSVVERTVEQSSLLLRGVTVETDDVPGDLRLPSGRFAEWVAIFQNLLVNAANATLDRRERRIGLRGYVVGREAVLLVQDTGCGVDPDEAEELFAPFARRQDISEERRALGAGGTGLGLTIVRMIARNLGCQVAFIPPEDGFSTAIRLSWRTG
ncbi:MAG: ATP-binding protein [Solirubrobacterales bacterium]